MNKKIKTIIVNFAQGLLFLTIFVLVFGSAINFVYKRLALASEQEIIDLKGYLKPDEKQHFIDFVKSSTDLSKQDILDYKAGVNKERARQQLLKKIAD